MADPQHLAILRRGIDAWNQWRKDNHDIQPDLSGTNFTGADLSGANLKNANLSSANLQGADLRWACLVKANLFESNLKAARLSHADLSLANLVRTDLGRADLCRARMSRTNLSRASLSRANLTEACLHGAILFGARLTGANLKGTNLSETNLANVDLSGAVIDRKTKLLRIKDAVCGVNGIYSDGTDSAAMLVPSPRGDSMLAPNADAVVESLTRARRYHGYSLCVAMIALIVLIMRPAEADLYDFGDYKTPFEGFTLFALIFTAGALIFTNAFLEDGLEGTRCLRDRDGAMLVGRFPWILTRFTGQRWCKRLVSLAARVCLAYHPLIYVLVPRESIYWYDWGLAIIIIWLTIRIFALSQQFQRPIIYDTKTEYFKRRDINALTTQLEDLLGQIKNSEKIRKMTRTPTYAPTANGHGATVLKPTGSQTTSG